MNDLAMLDREPVRLADGLLEDPAAMLLRSAQTDAAPIGAKDRVRAMLGIADDAGEENLAALPSPMEIMRARRQRVRRSRVIEPFIPFRNLTAPVKVPSLRKVGPLLVASLQVAAILAALFIRPFPKFEPRQEPVAARQEEPEMLFFAPRNKKKTEVVPAESLAKNTPKSLPVRTRIATRSNSEREAPKWRESIVGDEQAGLYSENSLAKPEMDDSAANDEQKLALKAPTAPILFRAGMSHPSRISGIDPAYPTIAQMRRVSGIVIMRCTVTIDGAARDCLILKSPAYLDEAVLAASRTWRLTPAMENGRPVAVNYVFRFKFQLR